MDESHFGHCIDGSGSVLIVDWYYPLFVDAVVDFPDGLHEHPGKFG
jgi:hypothetical protein